MTVNAGSLTAALCLPAFRSDSLWEDPYMKNRIFRSFGAVFTSLCLAGTMFNHSVLSIPASAESGSCGADAVWDVTDGVLRIKGSGTVTGRGWSGQYNKVHTIIVENGITSLPDSSFYDFPSLTSLTLADSVSQIGSLLCYKCYNLKNLQLSKSLTKIPSYAFHNCTALTVLNLPSGVTEVEKEAFSGCINLTALTMPSSLEKIGNKAFYTNNAVKLSLNNGLKEIGASAFEMSCFSSVEIPDSVQTIGRNAFGIIYDKIYESGGSFYGSYDKANRVKIIGSSGSAAETYAKTYDHPFSTTSSDIPAHTHKGNWIVRQDASCETNGERYFVCTVCGQTVTEAIPATGHSWSAWKVETDASCGKEGSMVRTCSNCGTKEYDTIDAKQHSWSPWSIEINPSCTETGMRKHTCLNCGESETETVPALGHDWQSWTVETEATCGKDGTRVSVCADCGAKQYETIPALSHEWSEWTVLVQPSCGKEGDRVRYCLNCGEEVHGAIAALEHNWSEWTVAKQPSCGTEGQRVRSCANCGSGETEPIAALEHNWSEWRTEKAASCEQDGTITRVCTNCGDKQYQSVPATGHDWSGWTEDIHPDCEHNGQRSCECRNCGQKQYAVITSPGHQWSDWKTVLEPTLEKTGRKERTCTVCGKVQAEELARLPGHHITVTAGSGGTVTPMGDNLVAEDGSLTIRIIPDNGYSVASIILDGTAQTVSQTLTLNHITASHTVSVAFIQNVVQAKPVCVGVLTETNRNIWRTEEHQFSMSDFKITALISENGKTSSLDITKDCSPMMSLDFCEDAVLLGEQTLRFGYHGKNTAVSDYFSEQKVSVPVGVIMRGDVDMDGEITPFDSMLVLRASGLMMIELDPGLNNYALAAADTDLDGEVMPFDSTKILRYSGLVLAGFDDVSWD